MNVKDIKNRCRTVVNAYLPCFAITVLFTVMMNSAALAADADTSRYFHIRQEHTADNNILVSRPRQDDVKVADLIYRNNIQTVEDYAQWLNANIRFQTASVEDNWPNPQDVLKNKSGDCEDFAVLTSAVARALGYEPKFFAFVRRNAAHAVCAFKQDGVYVWFDNAQVIKSTARTEAEFIRYITKHYDYNEFLELNIETEEWTSLFKKA